MAWWGTLLGGTLGFMFGGPLGALLGAAVGRNFDHGLKATAREGVYQTGQQERVQVAFFTTTFSVMGHIAKADGKVTPDEISAAEAIMRQMQLDAGQRQAAIKLFNAGKQEDFQLHAVLAQFRQECHRRRNLVQMFLEIQISTAMADGRLHASEKSILYSIGEQLGFDRAAIEHLFSFIRSGAAVDSGRQAGLERPARGDEGTGHGKDPGDQGGLRADQAQPCLMRIAKTGAGLESSRIAGCR
jgi:DnaJ like chaperone protein